MAQVTVIGGSLPQLLELQRAAEWLEFLYEVGAPPEMIAAEREKLRTKAVAGPTAQT